MDTSKVLRAVINLVPNWYQSKCGWLAHSISVDGATETFFTERGLTPILCKFLAAAEAQLGGLIASVESIPDTLAIRNLQATLAKYWLEHDTLSINWGKLFSYNRDLDNRTYENDSVASKPSNS